MKLYFISDGFTSHLPKGKMQKALHKGQGLYWIFTGYLKNGIKFIRELSDEIYFSWNDLYIVQIEVMTLQCYIQLIISYRWISAWKT